jgi:Reverse transcriptase (RNA-dependent DNA polymerase)
LNVSPRHTSKSAIPSKMIMTPKKLPNGKIDRMKARLVAGGHRQDRTMYRDEETSSHTVALSSVLIAASLAAHNGDHVMTLDHEAAYLNAPMAGHTVHVRIGKEVATLLCQLDSTYSQHVRVDGTIVVRLRRALYGCIESAVL